jgi:hypothetical protein
MVSSHLSPKSSALEDLRALCAIHRFGVLVVVRGYGLQ